MSEPVCIDTRVSPKVTVTGRVLALGSTPIDGAMVALRPVNIVARTNSTGQFSLSDVPSGRGYRLEVIAANYEPHILNDATIGAGGQSLGDITLNPLTGVFKLRPLVPDINPATSEVEEDGVAYRYYLVRNEATQAPQGGVVVAVFPDGELSLPVDQNENISDRAYAGHVAGISDPNGTVRLRIPATEIGGPSFTRRFKTMVSDHEGPRFDVTVKPRKYEFFWAQESCGGLHGKVNLFVGGRIGAEAGHRLEVSRTYGEFSSAEELSRELAGRVELGVEYGLPIGGKAEVAGAKAGAYGSLGVGGYAELTRAFGYEFDRNSTDPGSAALRLYCAYAELTDYFPLIGPLLRWVREIIEPELVDDVYRWSKAGFEFGPYVTVDATLGARMGKSFAVGAYANADFEGSFHTSSQYFVNEGRRESEVGFGGELSTTAGIGLGFRQYAGTGRPAGFQRILKNLGVFGNVEASIMADQSAVTVSQDDAPYPSEVRLVSRLGASWSAFVSASRLLSYLGNAQSGENMAIMETELVQPVSSKEEWSRMKGLSGKLRLLFDRTAPVAMNGLFGDEAAQALFPVSPYQSDMRYEIRSRVVDQDKLEAGAEGHVVVGGGFKLKADLEKGRAVVLEVGKIRGGQVYPLELKGGLASVPYNDTTILDLQSTWFTQAASVITEAWNRFVQAVGEAGETVVYVFTETGEATLSAAQGAWAAGTNIIVEWWNPDADEALAVASRAYLRIAGQPATISQLYGVGGIYRFTADADPAVPVVLSLSYRDERLGDVDELSLRIYRRDDSNGKWALIGGTVDTVNNIITAPVTQLGIFALAPALPTGQLTFQLNAGSAPADGLTTVTAEASDLRVNNGAASDDGWLFTVAATGMQIVSADEDPELQGVQVGIVNGKLTLEFRAPSSGAVGEFVVASVFGDATGGGTIAFEDATPPPAVTGVTSVAGQSRIFVVWDAAGMPSDVAGYKVYYREAQSGPPYDGTASVEGQPSPVFTTSGEILLRGLSLSSDYYVAVSAVDATGNQGPLSPAVMTTTVPSRPAPPTEVHFQSDGPAQFIVAWILSEDDGFNDRDLDHYEVYRRIFPGDAFAKVATIGAGLSLFTDDDPGLADVPAPAYLVFAVDRDGLKSTPGGVLSKVDVNRDGYVDQLDLFVLIDCFAGPQAEADGYCVRNDFDSDDDVDLADFSIMQRCFSGRVGLAEPTCAP
ncbi:MAG: carboxypeptidase regulatory-like domain-containing protein [Planctomycetota bacterium]